MVSVRVATIAFGLEARPETAINGACTESPVSIPTELAALVVNFNDDPLPFVLVRGDIVWFPCSLADQLRQQISELAHTEEARVCLAASHTHGTPNSDRCFQFEQWSQGLENHIAQSVLRVVDNALKESANQAILKSDRVLLSGLAINRRRLALALRPKLGYRMQNLPNPSGTCDDRVDVVVLEDATTRRSLAVITRFTCHPVADANSVRGADYPGFFRHYVQSKLGSETPIFFLQGFCGDIRPNLQVTSRSIHDWLISFLVGPRFRKSSDGDAKTMGNRLGSRVVEVLQRMTSSPARNTCQAKAKRQRLEVRLVDGSESKRKLDLTIWDWSEVKFIFASGEMLSGLLPQYTESCLCIGYANGMTGYIPAAPDLEAGGYEVDASRQKFGLSARVTHQCCRQITAMIRQAVD